MADRTVAALCRAKAVQSSFCAGFSGGKIIPSGFRRQREPLQTALRANAKPGLDPALEPLHQPGHRVADGDSVDGHFAGPAPGQGYRTLLRMVEAPGREQDRRPTRQRLLASALQLSQEPLGSRAIVGSASSWARGSS